MKFWTNGDASEVFFGNHVVRIRRFQEYFQGFFEPMFNEVGGLNVDRNEGDSYDIVKFKVLIHSYACKMNVEGCVSQARDLFKEWQAHPERNP